MSNNFNKLNPKKVEKRINKIITKLNLSERINIDWLKDFIYNFDFPDNKVSQEYFGKIFDMLPKNISSKKKEEAVRAFNDAWNCFPQRVLGDKSPQDKYFEEISTEEKEINEKIKWNIPLNQEEKLLKNHFDKSKENIDAYLDWASKEIMPKYKKYVKNQKCAKQDDVIAVAGLFLEICGQMGFFEFNRIHPGFIEDFPEMFTIGSMKGSEIPKENIKEYLENFLFFLETYYPASTVQRTII